MQKRLWNWDLMWVYARHSKRKWFSSSMFLLSQRWQILSTHGVLGTVQRPVLLWSSCEFVHILDMLIFFLVLYIVHTFGKRKILAPLILKNGIYLINEIKKVFALYIMEPFYALCRQLLRFRVQYPLFLKTTYPKKLLYFLKNKNF